MHSARTEQRSGRLAQPRAPGATDEGALSAEQITALTRFNETQQAPQSDPWVHAYQVNAQSQRERVVTLEEPVAAAPQGSPDDNERVLQALIAHKHAIKDRVMEGARLAGATPQAVDAVITGMRDDFREMLNGEHAEEAMAHLQALRSLSGDRHALMRAMAPEPAEGARSADAPGDPPASGAGAAASPEAAIQHALASSPHQPLYGC